MEALMESWVVQFLGRLHPLVVHFPIGLLVTAFFMEWMTLGGKRPGLREGIRWMIWIGAGSAVLASLLGWFLLSTGAYGGDTAVWHQWFGIGTAVLALAVAWLLRRAHRAERGHRSGRPVRHAARTHYRIALSICLVGIGVTGHLGARLTHGADYLSGAFPWNRPQSMAGELLAEFRTVDTGAYSPQQLDRINLEVRALFAHRCYKCHGTEKQEGGLVLDNEAGVRAGGESGPIFVAGNAAESEIMRRLLLPRDDEDAMPQKAEALSREEIDLIGLWIDLGAPWAEGDVRIFPEAELALEKPSLPSGKDIDHPIDRFVDAYFEQEGIRWPKPVDDRTFVRRAYLDAIGLLPSPEQVDAFIRDKDRDKREKLVHTLLGQRHPYAQHWLSFWNDLLRNDYSGTGYITGGRKQITDWLYHALLTNQSYDEMVRALLSPTEDSEGFIRGIQWRGVANNSQRIEMQAAQNVSQSLLGVNLKCASCHDSFVSNLTLDEAYGFASVFADTVLEVFRCDQPTGRMSSPAFLYPELGVVEAETVEERLVQLTDIVVQPANGRLYRTIANRLWDRLLGRGIIMPVDEMDRAPWSQELLDWLAADLVDHGTDLQYLVTQIMTSRTYQLPSVPSAEAQDILTHAYRFRGPVRRRLSAEQLTDALSQTLGPFYSAVAYDPLGEDIEAQWIWHHEQEVDRDVLPRPGKRYFRYPFHLEQEHRNVLDAQALVSVDEAFVLYLNGERVAEGRDWRTVHRIDLTGVLRDGINLLAVEGENGGSLPNPAGVLFDLRLTFADSTRQAIFSNAEWKTTDELPGIDWTNVNYGDRDWQPARAYGRFDQSYWGQPVDFRHNPDREHLPFARASLVTLDPFLKVLGRPTRENVVTRRDDQATLLQALELTNGVFFNDTISAGAARWLDDYGDDSRMLVERLYHSALGRAPSRREMRTATALLGEHPTEEEVQDVLWAVFMLPDFQLIY